MEHCKATRDRGKSMGLYIRFELNEDEKIPLSEIAAAVPVLMDNAAERFEIHVPYIGNKKDNR